MSNRDDWSNVSIEIFDSCMRERLETELHNAYVAGQEQADSEIRKALERVTLYDPHSRVIDGRKVGFCDMCQTNGNFPHKEDCPMFMAKRLLNESK